jgi:hypothetical protein
LKIIDPPSLRHYSGLGAMLSILGNCFIERTLFHSSNTDIISFNTMIFSPRAQAQTYPQEMRHYHTTLWNSPREPAFTNTTTEIIFAGTLLLTQNNPFPVIISQNRNWLPHSGHLRPAVTWDQEEKLRVRGTMMITSNYSVGNNELQEGFLMAVDLGQNNVCGFSSSLSFAVSINIEYV